MSKKEKTEPEEVKETTEPEIYYVVNIYDNHGTINITQSGTPEDPPPTPPGGGKP